MSRDKTMTGATLDRITKQRRAGRATGVNEHRDQAKRLSANARRQAQPDKESVILRKFYEGRRKIDLEWALGDECGKEEAGNYRADSSSAPCIRA